jgi:hypothetical protein
MVAVYLLDSQFITDGAKFIAGCMQCQAAMMNLELPHVNVLSKVDLMEDKLVLEPYLNPDHPMLARRIPTCTTHSPVNDDVTSCALQATRASD